MRVLKGELIQGDIAIQVQEQYTNKRDFFIALVSISDRLDVGVPIWTMREDYLLKRKKEVFFSLEDGMLLRIFI